MRSEFRPLIISITLLLIGLLVLAGLATAGRNAHGALIVHTSDYISTADPCGDDFFDRDTCQDTMTQTNNDDGIPTWIWFIAAFPEPLEPLVRAIRFGHDHNLPPDSHLASGACGPSGTQNWPSLGWPDAPETSGNVVEFPLPISGNLSFPFYWVLVAGFEGAYYGTSVHGGHGYAAFYDDNDPPVLDRVERFGQVRWFEPGYNECPETPPFAACCSFIGECELLPDALCVLQEGQFLADEPTCDPNPCPQYPGACCFEDGLCEFQMEIDCEDISGTWMGAHVLCNPSPCTPRGACCYDEQEENCIVLIELWCQEQHDDTYIWIEGEDCDPHPCPWLPAVEQTTWGMIRATYWR